MKRFIVLAPNEVAYKKWHAANFALDTIFQYATARCDLGGYKKGTAELVKLPDWEKNKIYNAEFLAVLDDCGLREAVLA